MPLWVAFVCYYLTKSAHCNEQMVCVRVCVASVWHCLVVAEDDADEAQDSASHLIVWQLLPARYDMLLCCCLFACLLYYDHRCSASHIDMLSIFTMQVNLLLIVSHKYFSSNLKLGDGANWRYPSTVKKKKMQM